MLTYDFSIPLNKANQTPKLNIQWPLNKANYFWPQIQICPDGAEKNYQCFIWGGFHALIHTASSLDLTLRISNFQK